MVNRSRSSHGFTLIELLVVVTLIGILAAIAVPNYIGAQDKAKVAQVKANIHTVQLAAESYAVDAYGWYPDTAQDVAPYLAGGSNTPGGRPGRWPVNPFLTSGISGPADDASSITDVTAARNLAAGSFVDKAGGIVYDHGTGPHSFAIWGCDGAGKSIAGNAGKQLVLSTM